MKRLKEYLSVFVIPVLREMDTLALVATHILLCSPCCYQITHSVFLDMRHTLVANLCMYIIDMDECARPGEWGECGLDAVCENTPGSFMCVCREGFVQDGDNCTSKRYTPDLVFSSCLMLHLVFCLTQEFSLMSVLWVLMIVQRKTQFVSTKRKAILVHVDLDTEIMAPVSALVRP